MVHMYLCMCMCIYIYLYVHVYFFVRMHVSACMCMCMCMVQMVSTGLMCVYITKFFYWEKWYLHAADIQVGSEWGVR